MLQPICASYDQETLGYAKKDLPRSLQQNLIPFFLKKSVKNGGTLTHTDDDFRRANYFFCDGMDDPWLNEYVVKH